MPGLIVSVDTSFVLNLEAGHKLEIEVFERLTRSGHAIRIVPVVSHELIELTQKGGPSAEVSLAFLAKMHIYGISRLELDGPQKDYAKCAAEKLIEDKLLHGNIAHFVGESACRENCFIISDLSEMKKVKWGSVQKVLDGNQIHPIRHFTKNRYLKA